MLLIGHRRPTREHIDSLPVIEHIPIVCLTMYPIWKALRGACICVLPAQVFTGISVIYGTRVSKKDGTMNTRGGSFSENLSHILE